MRSISITLLTIIITLSGSAQTQFSVGFEKDSISVTRSKEKIIVPLDIVIDSLPADSLYRSLKLSYDLNKSTYPYNAIRLSNWEVGKQELIASSKKLRLYLEVQADSIGDRDRTLFINLEVLDDETDSVILVNMSKSTQLQLTLHSNEALNKISNFENLAYLGTNFDLAQGKIESNNLFFASNVLKQPKTTHNNVGVYLSIFGNRAMTQIDSTGTITFRQNVPLSDTTHTRINLRNEILSETTTDNIGAFISPLIRIKWFQTSPKKSKDFALYYAPSLEFVWRRTTEVRTFNEISRDSLVVVGEIDVQATNLPSNGIVRTYNEYAFNVGILGLFMILENESISVRVHGSVGYSAIYSGIDASGSRGFNHASDMFFTGRAWITEPNTGLTLQAEVNNAWNNPRPFFVATISKAFSLRDLGAIFKPITQR